MVHVRTVRRKFRKKIFGAHLHEFTHFREIAASAKIKHNTNCNVGVQVVPQKKETVKLSCSSCFKQVREE